VSTEIMKVILAACAAVFLVAYTQAACVDRYSYCKLFVERNICKTKISYAKYWCAKTCGFCGTPDTPAPPTAAPTAGPTEGPTAPPQPGTCGKPEIQGQRVIAGVTATRGSWPWQILMLYNGRGGCGGSIVGPRHVVTAAHCVAGRTRYPTRFSVRVGEHNTRTTEGSEKEYRVKRVFQHPEYQRPTPINNDIAVFELEKPIQFNKYVSSVCLPDKDVPVGTDCYITGWGKVRHPGYMTNILQQAKMPVVSKDVCHKKNYNAIRIPVTDAMVCSGDGGNTRKSGCHGDSGGPFVCQIGGRWELHGAVSHGSPRCASTETYTVFARVAYFKKWIDNVMSQ